MIMCESRLVYLTGRGSKLGIDAAKKLPGDGFKCAWPPRIEMDAALKAKVEKLLTRSHYEA